MKKIIILLFFIIGMAVGSLGTLAFLQTRPLSVESTLSCKPAPDSVPKQGCAYDEGYQAALDFAKKKLANGPILYRDQPLNEIRNASIRSIEGSRLMLEINASDLDPFLEGRLIRTAAVGDKTILETHRQKPLDQFLREMARFGEEDRAYFQTFREHPDSATESLRPERPVPYDIEPIRLVDLKPGDLVHVRTSSDIRNTDSFDLDSVSVTIPSDANPSSIGLE